MWSPVPPRPVRLPSENLLYHDRRVRAAGCKRHSQQAAEGACAAQGCIFTLDSGTGLCTNVERIEIR